jgi:hypothetical protein
MIVPFYKKSTKITIYVLYIIWPLLVLSGAIWRIVESDYILSTLLLILFLILVPAMIKDLKNGTMESKAIIDEKGITVESKKKKFSMQWIDMNLVGYGINVIIFSRKFDKRVFKLNLRFEHMSNDMVYLMRRPGLIDEIKKYWKGPIIGE